MRVCHEYASMLGISWPFKVTRHLLPLSTRRLRYTRRPRRCHGRRPRRAPNKRRRMSTPSPDLRRVRACVPMEPGHKLRRAKRGCAGSVQAMRSCECSPFCSPAPHGAPSAQRCRPSGAAERERWAHMNHLAQHLARPPHVKHIGS